MTMPIFNEDRRMERYRQKLEELEKEISLERNLSVSRPQIIGAAVVIPAEPQKEIPMRRDDEIELIGMQLSMENEINEGWVPEDVSKQNLGFDVRSTLYNNDGTFSSMRYIEVKARAVTGSIYLSANEWKKAQRFGKDFWLYIVTKAGSSNPTLNKIDNPAKKFKIDDDMYATSYNIPEENWRSKV